VDGSPAGVGVYLPRLALELMRVPTPEDAVDLQASADQLMSTGR